MEGATCTETNEAMTEGLSNLLEEGDDADSLADANDPPKKKENSPSFPAELNNFSFEDRRFMTCGLELEPIDGNTTNYLEVAQKIVGFNGDDNVVVLNKLSVINMRILAKKFGLKNLGSCTKFAIRLMMAMRKNSTTRYNIDVLASSTVSANDNTKNIVRIINAVFHPDNYETFLTLNDRMTRADYEVGKGAKNRNFWAMIADNVNDASSLDLDHFMVIDNNEDWDKYINYANDTGYVPVACSQQTGVTCKSLIESCVKIRSTIISNMTKSGQNSHDPYQYTAVAIKRQNLVRTVSNFSAYYFYMACAEHPEMDGVLRRYLGQSIKGNSSESLEDDVPTSSKKKDHGELLTKMVAQNDWVGGQFGDHFVEQKKHFVAQQSHYDDQRKRFADLTAAESTKQYWELKVAMLKEPMLADDETLKRRMASLKMNIDSSSQSQSNTGYKSTEPSPARKKNKNRLFELLKADDSSDSSIGDGVPTPREIGKELNDVDVLEIADDGDDGEDDVSKRILLLSGLDNPKSLIRSTIASRIKDIPFKYFCGAFTAYSSSSSSVE